MASKRLRSTRKQNLALTSLINWREEASKQDTFIGSAIRWHNEAAAETGLNSIAAAISLETSHNDEVFVKVTEQVRLSVASGKDDLILAARYVVMMNIWYESKFGKRPSTKHLRKALLEAAEAMEVHGT